LVLAPNGRDPEVFRPRTPHESEVGAPLLAFVGALNSGKGPDRFVKVVGELRRQQVALRAAMVGGGPLHGELAAPAAEAGIEMLGTLEDVAPVLRRADVMLFPSRPTGEGMPGVLIEAGLSGLPVVASRVPGVAMIVDDGVTGLVVDGGDTDAMVQATARLLTDEALRQRMGAAARVRCAERFSLDAVVSIWWSFLEPLFERGLSRRRARNGPGSRPGPVA
ncbi:MAG TPA: glycosyltransferase family 4 protein, partial [Acidimicrobiales bacterium]|nr:glycosyltransferase family 4 protein [Acidimicrobiales bacterium]